MTNYKDVSSLYGVEFSEESVNSVNILLNKNDKFGKCVAITEPVLPWEDNVFDFVFITEVIEHLEKGELINVLNEIKRVLKKNGKIIISVPNNENLNINKKLCPECGAVFHPVQHINSFSKEILKSMMAKIGFDKIFCEGIFIAYYNKFSLKIALKKQYYKFNKTPYPNLIYIGNKK